MENTQKQELINQFTAELVLLPEDYLVYFLGMIRTFRQQVEQLDPQKEFEIGVQHALNEVEAIENENKPAKTLDDLLNEL